MHELQFFDREVEYWVKWRRLPHWSQPGTVCFITWRAADSMPKAVLGRWLAERKVLLKKHGIALEPAEFRETGPRANVIDWNATIRALPRADREKIRWKLAERWDMILDECHGACVLTGPELSQVVADSLQYFDGDRYTLTDFVTVANHVHLMAAFPDEKTMLAQCHSWKRYTATRINRSLGRTGEFWQTDGFDHLVRSEEQFLHFRRYIAENSVRAGLRDGEYRHYSKPLPL